MSEDGVLVGVFFGAAFGMLLAIFLLNLEERQCERLHNVWDCAREYHPVFDEMSPEDEELIP